MPNKYELKKLKDLEVNKLKGKLIEVRRIGANPIFIEVTKSDTVSKALVKADIPTEGLKVKVEGIKGTSTQWKKAKLSAKIYQFDKIAVTTKVKGS